MDLNYIRKRHILRAVSQKERGNLAEFRKSFSELVYSLI